MFPPWVGIAVLAILAIAVIGWAMSHIVWIALGAVIGYCIRDMVGHAANRTPIVTRARRVG
jgi:hypothetical protein